MDPKATLIDLLENIAARNYNGAQDNLDDLTDWLRKGGHVPDDIHKALDALRFN